MLRKLLLRIVLALALILLVLGWYTGLDSEVPSRLIENMAEKARLLGFSQDSGGDHWDTIIDVTPLLKRLEDGDTSFDWAEWIDLDKVKMYESRDLDPKLYPYLMELTYNEKPVMPYEYKTSPQEQAMLGRIYCKRYLSAPFRVIPIQNPARGADENILSGPNSLRTAPMKQYQVTHARKELRHRQFGHEEPTEYYETSEPLVPDLKAPVDEIGIVNLTFPRVDEAMFNWDVDDLLDFYDNSGFSGHATTIREGLVDIAHSEKHFYEVWIRDDPVGYGVHYDWRFFRGILPHDEHIAATHAIARTWQQFAEQMGISYWYAHGSLLGYLWNGMAMPWDSDHDIQVPILELDRLARDFNRTLVVQHPSEGYRKYLLDVGPYYVQRMRGNGNNVIDARFIDVDSGVFIDITGLARTNPHRKMVSCKNRHLYQTEEYARIRRSNFEGYPALVPVDFAPMLQKEYRRYSTPRYKLWSFNFKVRLWEFTETCAKYLSKYPTSIHVYCFPSDIKKDDGCEEEFGTCDKVTIKNYELTKETTESHAAELELTSDLLPITTETRWDDEQHEEVSKKILDIIGVYRPPFHNSTMLDIDVAGEPFNPEEPQLAHA